MEQLSLEELGLITGGVGFLDSLNVMDNFVLAASPNDIPPRPFFP